ncbi:RNA-binding family protein [Hibiscus syriacus]|uniref:KAT8 regulatory NSL complex subunit 2 n=2 Tax=Hibiscus syriacus TaxID=106335 RepID=A0A6A3A060_HIBSY|nr:RNA-binding family protein [Hibiscus syriacus]
MSSPPSQDVVLARATHLTREELLKRRLQHLRQLSRCYRHHYWALMDNLKIQYRNYYWKFGISPFKQNSIQEDDAPLTDRAADNNVNVNDSNNNNNVGLNFRNNQHCSFVGCKFKAMALTRFCHLHILSDSKQKLYKACTYVIKSAHAGPITCGKPILRSAVPSLCTAHFQKTQKNVNRALKKANLNVSSLSKLAPMFHVIVAEYVHQIQAKRRAVSRGITSKTTIKEECPS